LIIASACFVLSHCHEKLQAQMEDHMRAQREEWAAEKQAIYAEIERKEAAERAEREAKRAEREAERMRYAQMYQYLSSLGTVVGHTPPPPMLVAAPHVGELTPVSRLKTLKFHSS